jgi:hypothetical protein
VFEPIRLPLRLPIGAPLPVDVIDATPSLSQYRITVRVPPQIWETIDMVDAFNLESEARQPGQITGDGDVQIELRLADAEVPALIRRIAGMTPSDGVAELAESPADSPLLITENWFALHVTEAVELPPELRGPGREVRSGFSTKWVDSDSLVYSPAEFDFVVEQPTDPEDEPWPPLLAAVRDYLDSHEVSFVRHPKANMVSADIQGNNDTWSMWIHTREAERQVLVYSISPQPVDEAHRGAVAELIGRLNLRMRAGNFEMDPDNGSFRCRTSLIVNEAPLDSALLDGVIAPNSVAMDDGMFSLRSLLAGASIDDALSSFPNLT